MSDPPGASHSQPCHHPDHRTGDRCRRRVDPNTGEKILFPSLKHASGSGKEEVPADGPVRPVRDVLDAPDADDPSPPHPIVADGGQWSKDHQGSVSPEELSRRRGHLGSGGDSGSSSLDPLGW